MFPLLQPLFQENHHEHGGHDKGKAPGIEMEHIPQKAPHKGAGHPVGVIQEGHPEHIPVPVYVVGDGGRIIQGKCLVAHPENQERFLPAAALVFLQHGQTVEKMPCLYREGHDEILPGRKGRNEHGHRDELQGAAENDHGHEGGIQEIKSQGMHVKTVSKSQKPEPCKYGERIRKSLMQRPQGWRFCRTHSTSLFRRNIFIVVR